MIAILLLSFSVHVFVLAITKGESIIRVKELQMLVITAWLLPDIKLHRCEIWLNRLCFGYLGKGQTTQS